MTGLTACPKARNALPSPAAAKTSRTGESARPGDVRTSGQALNIITMLRRETRPRLRMSSPARSVVLCQRAAMPLGATAFLQRGAVEKPTSPLRREGGSDFLAGGVEGGGVGVWGGGGR